MERSDLIIFSGLSAVLEMTVVVLEPRISFFNCTKTLNYCIIFAHKLISG